MELVSLRDKFASRLSHQVNSMFVRFSAQLMRIAPGVTVGGSSSAGGVSGSVADLSGSGRYHHRLHVSGAGSVLSLSGSRSNLSGSNGTAGGGGANFGHCYELLAVQREEMLQMSSLVGGWLQNNRTDVFRTLKKVSYENGY